MRGAPDDQTTRRDTPFAIKLKQRIARDGPMSVAEYMHACLQDPEHGYYVKHNAIGATGDFITAPEISQVFGELIGLWAAVVWQQMGSPEKVNLVELGPGRGTMMRDALRAARMVKGFAEAASIHLVENSEPLKAAQRQTLSAISSPLSWGRALDGFSTPAIILANEFLDALPIAQWIKTQDGWCERGVEVDDKGELCFVALPNSQVRNSTGSPSTTGFILGLGPKTHQAADSYNSMGERDAAKSTAAADTATSGKMGSRAKPEDDHFIGLSKTLDRQFPDAPFGAIAESARLEFVTDALKALAVAGPVVALFIDYGHATSSIGETLQAVRNHKFEEPLTSPGEADLSSHVDFAAFALGCHAAGLETDGPITQAEFLGRLGIIERASKLMSANPAKAAAIETAIARLMAPGGMGGRFKVMGVRSKVLSVLPGF